MDITFYPYPNGTIVRTQVVDRGVTMHSPYCKFLSQIFCRLSVIREQWLAFVLQDWVVFTLIWLIFSWLIVI